MSELTKDWKKVKLGEVAEFTNGGAWNSKEYADFGIPVVQVTNISNNTIDLDQCKYLSRESLTKYKKHMLFEGDLVIATVGSHPTQPNSVVGRVAMIPKFAQGSLLNQNAVRLSPKSKEMDRKYLGHLGKSQFFRNYIIAHSRGSANQVRMSIGLLKEMDIRLPPLFIQKKIASILSNYDDLIENNTQRIEILEEMAKLVYEEWFVKFRFLGHENVKMVSSELGKIPEGWEVHPIREITTLIKRGITPKYEESSKNTVINQKCIRNFRLNLEESRRHVSKVPQEKLLVKGDILINSTGIGTLGRVSQVLEDLSNCTVDTHVTIVRPNKKISFSFFGLQLFRLQSYFESQGRGATGQTELGRDTIEEAKFIVAPNKIQDLFSNLVDPLRSLVIKLEKKNQNLRKTRDLLLPKLISGEIDVSYMDIRVQNPYQEP